jgi:hypothetical protein
MHEHDGIIGDPSHDAAYWDHQTLDNDCAVVAQMSIINEYRDTPISETQAVFDASSHGWLGPGGTAPEDVGKLFDLYDIPYHTEHHATMNQLAWELDQGHHVIVGVNSSDLWSPNPITHLFDSLGLSSSDHALCVTGIDDRDPAHPMVCVNDSGDPAGAGKEYPLNEFMEAWQGSDFFYAATSEPAAGFHGLNFNIADYLGIGLVASAASFVDNLVESANWDQILQQV